jgi:uncharacterized coiled-coil protein SlyX
VAEQEDRIARQEALIERLRKLKVPVEPALRLLDELRDLLVEMRGHLARLNKP